MYRKLQNKNLYVSEFGLEIIFEKIKNKNAKKNQRHKKSRLILILKL